MNELPYVKEVKINHKAGNPDEYPLSIPSIANISSINFQNQVTFIIGENGTGKSTLLEAIAIALGFNPEGGSKNFTFSSRDTHSNLHNVISLDRSFLRPRDGYFFRAESYYNLASSIDELDKEELLSPQINSYYGGKSLHHQSHGESFLSLLLYRFSGKGLYLLDEPEAALSPARQMTTLARMGELVKEDSQFIIATHSPILMAFPGACIYSLDEKGIREVEYRDTDHYQITRAFMENPEGMLSHLL